MTELAAVITQAIDLYRAEHPELTVMETLEAIELIRHKLTEAFLST